ncbi:hypothetical protein Hdeb2414_s0009g00324611 [Helianthus debilis subsp. tardiflorus]
MMKVVVNTCIMNTDLLSRKRFWGNMGSPSTIYISSTIYWFVQWPETIAYILNVILPRDYQNNSILEINGKLKSTCKCQPKVRWG